MKARITNTLFVLAVLLCVSIQVVSIDDYLDDKRYLQDLVNRIADPSLPPSDQVKEIIAFFRDKPASTNESYYLLPMFRFLRPTARQVAEGGGDCADRSRLLVVLLRLRGIQASKWALYDEKKRPQHAVVQVRAERGDIVVDPLFGLCFPRPDGWFFGIKDLKDDPEILRERIRFLTRRGERPGSLSLEHYPLNKYIYTNARTINWDKSFGMKMLYRVMYLVAGNKVDDIPRPAFAEEPAFMVIFGLIFGEAAILLAWRLTRKRT